MYRRLWRLVGMGVLSGAVLHCGQRQHVPPFELPEPVDAGADVGLQISDAGPTSANLCGNQQIPAIADPPNLYFIVDRSGSMADPLPGSAYNKYQSAVSAIATMLRAVGHRVKYGAAVFPALANPDGCSSGIPVFLTEPGDPPSFALAGENGPILQALLTRLDSYAPTGGTPTAQTLTDLEPLISGLSGKKTYVVLMTDGAPNCNVALSCDASGCIPNIEHASIGTTACAAPVNCCDALQPSAGGIGYCVDSAATIAAVDSYEQAGIDTFIVGMPGSEAYANLLTKLAQAGNTARPSGTAYYAVSDTNDLADALKAIGAQVAITCDLPLSFSPDDLGMVNVYFDGTTVPYDPSDGWHWLSGTPTIRFEGAACSSLSSGNVLDVQVLAGCPTVVPQ